MSIIRESSYVLHEKQTYTQSLRGYSLSINDVTTDLLSAFFIILSFIDFKISVERRMHIAVSLNNITLCSLRQKTAAKFSRLET